MSAPPLFARTWGEGPPVLLLHGLGASSRYWDALAGDSDGYAATAPDLLGFGRSPKPADAAYDVAGHLDALAPLVQPGVTVVGHSTGAILAAALAAARPGSVRSLLLLGLPAFEDEATARRDVGRLGLLARLTVDGSPIARAVCEALCRVRPLAVAVAPLLIRDLPAPIVADGARHTWLSYRRTLERVVVAHRVAPDLDGTTATVTLLHGSGDRTAPVDHVGALVAGLRTAGTAVELRIVSGDHHLAVRRPSVVAHELDRLLSNRA